MQFQQTRECEMRINCYRCRNDEKYRAMIARAFGRVPTQAECPLRLPDGAGLADMPTPARKAEEFRARHDAHMMAQKEKAVAFLEKLAQRQPELLEEAQELLSHVLRIDGKKEKCRWRRVTDEDTGAPCRGKYIICENPESPIYGQRRIWWESKCNRMQCKFFAPMSEEK